MITKEQFREWIKGQYPNGNIDWKDEYERLISMLEQAIPSIRLGKTNASTKHLDTCLEIGKFLLEEK